jgi:hypothetical protein
LLIPAAFGVNIRGAMAVHVAPFRTRLEISATEKDGVGTSRRLERWTLRWLSTTRLRTQLIFVHTTHGAHPLSRHVILAHSGPL